MTGAAGTFSVDPPIWSITLGDWQERPAYSQDRASKLGRGGSNVRLTTSLGGPSRRQPVRVYFNLVRGTEILEDEDGLDVADPHSAHVEALKALRDLKRAEPSASADWIGWRLDIVDASGAVLDSIKLDAIPSDSG